MRHRRQRYLVSDLPSLYPSSFWRYDFLHLFLQFLAALCYNHRGQAPRKNSAIYNRFKNSKDSRNLYCRTSSKDSTFEIARERESPKTTHSNIQLVTSRSFDSTPWVSSSAILLERGRVRDYMVSGRTLIVWSEISAVRCYGLDTDLSSVNFLIFPLGLGLHESTVDCRGGAMLPHSGEKTRPSSWWPKIGVLLYASMTNCA